MIFNRCIYSFFLLLQILFVACGDNPLGRSQVDSEFGSDNFFDKEAPTQPSALNVFGFATLDRSPTLAWTASTDNKAVTSYEIAVGTTFGSDDIFPFTDVGDVTTYQVNSITPNMNAVSSYFLSVRAKDDAGNVSDIASSSSWAPALVQTTSAFHYPDNTYAVHCLEYLNSGYYNAEGDGLYWIDPDGAGAGGQIQARCDMTRDGGGWTLVANRRGGGNNTDCGVANLNTFFQGACGAVSSIGYGDSYSIGDTDARASILENNEFMFLQFDNMGALDSDDAFIIHHNADLFLNSVGVLNRYSVTKVCDVNNENCDSTGVEFLWVGNGYFSSSTCSGGLSTSTYFGNYGYCHNGNGGYSSNSLFGNRSSYDETKLWLYTSKSSDFYQEQIYLR